MSNTINIIGHKSPDLDSVAAAAGYAYLKNQIDPANSYVANRAGEANAETKYIFEKFGVALPEILTSSADKKIILVDHNEKSQTVDLLEQAELVEIIDHHKMKFEYHDPIFIHVEPIGSTCTILFKMFKCHEVVIPKDLVGVLLSGMLVDTVITRSPTCTKKDVSAIQELSQIIGVDYTKFGLEVFKVRSQVNKLAPEAIITSDYKDFDINGKKFGVGQVETVDLSEFAELKSGLLKALQEKKQIGGYHTVVLFITDILQEGSQFLVVSDEPAKFNKAFTCGLINNECYLAGIMSRKKQVIPALLENY